MFSTRKGESLFFTFPSRHPSISPPFLCEGPSRVVGRLSLWVISPAACHFSGAPVRKRPLWRIKGRWETLRADACESPWRNTSTYFLPDCHHEDVTSRRDARLECITMWRQPTFWSIKMAPTVTAWKRLSKIAMNISWTVCIFPCFEESSRHDNCFAFERSVFANKIPCRLFSYVLWLIS